MKKLNLGVVFFAIIVVAMMIIIPVDVHNYKKTKNEVENMIFKYESVIAEIYSLPDFLFEGEQNDAEVENYLNSAKEKIIEFYSERTKNAMLESEINKLKQFIQKYQDLYYNEGKTREWDTIALQKKKNVNNKSEFNTKFTEAKCDYEVTVYYIKDKNVIRRPYYGTKRR